MPTLTLRGAFIRFVDLRYDEKSKSVYTKINITAAFSDPVRESMGWGELQDGYAAADLDGEYATTKMVLSPNGLSQHEIELDTKEMGSFSVHRVTSEDGESTENELRFQVVTVDPKAASTLAKYLATVGKGEAQMRIKYEAQSTLEEEAQEKLISDEQAAETTIADQDIGTRKGGRKKAAAEKVN